MTRDDFVAKWGDVLNGLLLAAIAEASTNRDFCDDKHMGIRGRFMLTQMKRGRDMLKEMFDDLQPPKEEPARASPPAQQAVRPGVPGNSSRPVAAGRPQEGLARGPS